MIDYIDFDKDIFLKHKYKKVKFCVKLEGIGPDNPNGEIKYYYPKLNHNRNKKTKKKYPYQFFIKLPSHMNQELKKPGVSFIMTEKGVIANRSDIPYELTSHLSLLRKCEKPLQKIRIKLTQNILDNSYLWEDISILINSHVSMSYVFSISEITENYIVLEGTYLKLICSIPKSSITKEGIVNLDEIYINNMLRGSSFRILNPNIETFINSRCLEVFSGIEYSL